MRKIWNKGHRIRASDKHLVYHFSIGTLLFVFVAVLLLLNMKQLMRTDWEHFSLLENGLTLSPYNFITILIATGVCALVAFLYYRFYYDSFKKLLHRQKLARMILENKWYEADTVQDSGFFTDLQSRSGEKIVWFPKIYYQMEKGLLHIRCEITLGKYQDQLLRLEDKLESGLYCELTDKTLHDGYIEYTLLYDMIANRITIDEVRAENGCLRLMKNLVWEYDALPHALIAGGTGGGKTYFLLTLIEALLHTNAVLYMSNVKRKDSKNRNLRNGESQRKDGRYVYKYTDIYGKPQFIYSWKLVPTDKTPAGKRDDISLREKEAQIKKDLNDGIDTAGGKMTVCQLYDKKNSQRKNIKRATEKGRQYLMNALKNDPLGMRAIDTVKQSDAKEWAIRMSEKGYAYKTIDNYKRSLKASFYMAIQDDCIRKNPFEFKLSDVLEDDTEQKVILTPEQEERLLAFMEKDKIYSKYYDEVVLLLETGLRISEFCGLTTHIDMQNRILNIDHQLLKDSEIGYYIETPKTKNGKRELPLTERAYQAIQRILKNRGKAQPLIVGGYSNFLFLNREGLPKVAGNYEGMVRGLIKKYNKYHTDKLPNITPHSFRHTYCTNMANRGMNPNTLQYLMGHANITMTLGYYAHGTFQSAKAELERLAC